MKSFKKLAITLLSVLTVACGAAGLAACLPTDVLNSSTSGENAVSSESVSTDEESGESSGQESTSSEDSTDGKENEIIKHEETSHLKMMETNQASQTVENENGEQTTYEAELIETYREGELYFLRYKIGKIENYCVQPVITPIFWNGKTLPDYTYTKGQLESSTISEGLSNSISTTDSTSVMQSGKEVASWSFDDSSSLTGKLEVELGVSATGKFQASLEATREFLMSEGKEREDVTSEEVSSAVTKVINDSYNMSSLQQKYDELQLNFPSDMWYDYEPGYFYALCMLADIEIYQIISYNVTTNKFYTTYFMGAISKIGSFAMMSAESAGFEIPADYQLKPITEISLDTVRIAFESNGGTELDPTYTLNGEGLADRLPVVTREHHEFGGWYTDEALTEEVNGDSIFSNDTVLYAKWTPVTYKITYETNGGVIQGNGHTSEYCVGDEIVLPDLSGEDCFFNGWYTDSAYTTAVNVEELRNAPRNVTLYADYLLLKQNKTFDVELNPNTNTDSDSEFIEIKLDSFNIPELIERGYKFEVTVAYTITMSADNKTPGKNYLALGAPGANELWDIDSPHIGICQTYEYRYEQTDNRSITYTDNVEILTGKSLYCVWGVWCDRIDTHDQYFVSNIQYTIVFYK